MFDSMAPGKAAGLFPIHEFKSKGKGQWDEPCADFMSPSPPPCPPWSQDPLFHFSVDFRRNSEFCSLRASLSREENQNAEPVG